MSQQIRKIYVLRLKVVVHFAEVWLMLLLMFFFVVRRKYC